MSITGMKQKKNDYMTKCFFSILKTKKEKKKNNKTFYTHLFRSQFLCNLRYKDNCMSLVHFQYTIQKHRDLSNKDLVLQQNNPTLMFFYSFCRLNGSNSQNTFCYKKNMHAYTHTSTHQTTHTLSDTCQCYFCYYSQYKYYHSMNYQLI